VADPVSPSSYVASVVDLIASLTGTDDDPGVLAVTLAHLHAWRPDAAELVLVDRDPDGRPQAPRVVVAWRAGHVLQDSQEVPAPDLPAALWTDPRQVHVSDAPAVALLPLHNTGHGGWLGALRLIWSSEHRFTADERDCYALVMAAVAAHLGALRGQQRLRATLAERELLHDVSRQLNLTTTLQEWLRVLVEPAPHPDEAEVVLCRIDSDEAGAPSWLTVLSILPAKDRPPGAELGARYHLPSIPFAELYLSSPGEPLLLGDIASDPRVDEVARELYARTGTRSSIVMALTLQGRWVGLLNISWFRPIHLGDREQRIYQSLARQAALQLEYSLLADRQRELLHDSLQQRQLLQTVLDNVPVGILMLAAPSSRPVLVNPAASRLLSTEVYNQAEPPASQAPYTLVYPGTDRPIPAERLVGIRAAATGEMLTEAVDVLPVGRDRVHLEVTAVPMRATDGRVGPIRDVVLVLADITARKRAEEERLRLQDEVIRVQAAALAERSSPIIPITDDILVLPIIGSIDAERGQQILAAILEGASQRRARVAILDITGVGTVDTRAAAALTSAARALRLLGVEPVLSGIRPDVAQALVNLGVSLDGVATCGTLQSSIQHALHRLGRATLA